MKDGVYRSLCGMCHNSCGIIARIESGKLAELKGDPEHPANRGYLCSKVAAIEEITRSPDRLQTPLKKTSAGFREISWDAAFDFAAEKLSAVLRKYGPKGLIRCGGAPVNYEARDGFQYLMKVCGSVSGTGSSSSCMVPRATAFNFMIGGKPEPDFDNADMIIMWGSNPAATNRLGNYCAYDGVNKVLDRARNRGASVIFIDPLRSESIKNSDEWIPINNGTDSVLALAMIRHIVENGLYHKDFVSTYTVGFEKLAEQAQPYSPESAADITGIPAEAIISLADRFAKSPRATICDGNGLDMYCNTVYTVQTIVALLGLTGRIDAEGGVVFLPFVPQRALNDLNPADMALRYKFPLFRDVPFSALKEALLSNDPDSPKAMIVHHANPAIINANSARTKAALEKLEFLMVDDIFMTATAQLADLVLPSVSSFERYCYKAYSSFDRGFAALSRPLFDAPGQAKTVFEMEYEIAKRINPSASHPFWDDKSWINFVLSPSHITFDMLDEQQIVYIDKPVVYHKYKSAGFATPSKKMELYSERMKKSGYSPVPIVCDASGGTQNENAEEYPLLVTNRRPGAFVQTTLHNLSSLTGNNPMPEMWISKQDADENGIFNKSVVIVETKNGRGEFMANIRPEQKKGLIALDFGWGNPTDNGADFNMLTDDSVYDPIGGGSPQRIFRGRIAARP